MRRYVSLILAFCLAWPTLGCSLITEFDDLDRSKRETFELPFREQGDMPLFDVLFVVDRPSTYNSAVMGAMDDMAEGAPGLFAGMNAVLSLPDLNWSGVQGILHFGVISSDLGAGGASLTGCDELGDDGILQAVDPPTLEAEGITGCGWLQDPYLLVQNEQVLNMVDASDVPMTDITVDEALRCMVMTQMFRQTSCPVRQPLGAFRKAVFEHNEVANAGFLRSTAGMAVVFISSEDDCSAVDPSLYQVEAGTFGPYTCFSQGLACEENQPGSGIYTKCRDRSTAEGSPLLQLESLYQEVTAWKQRSRVVVSVMAGPYGPEDPAQVIMGVNQLPTLKETCGDRLEGLYGLPGVRLELFREMFQENSVFHEICDPQVNQLFTRLSQKLAAQLTYRCMPYMPADNDGDLENGRQIDCHVRDQYFPDTTDEVYSEYYPHCDSAPVGATCWEVMFEEDCVTSYKMVVNRTGEPTDPYIVEADCDIDVSWVPDEGAGGP